MIAPPGDVRAAQDYVRACARALGIRHEIVVRAGKDGEDYAEVTRELDHRAVIVLHARWWRSPPAMKRSVVAHELIHLVTWPLAALVPDTHAEARSDTEELLVDTIASMVSRHLPPWTRRRRK